MKKFLDTLASVVLIIAALAMMAVSISMGWYLYILWLDHVTR